MKITAMFWYLWSARLVFSLKDHNVADSRHLTRKPPMHPLNDPSVAAYRHLTEKPPMHPLKDPNVADSRQLTRKPPMHPLNDPSIAAYRHLTEKPPMHPLKDHNVADSRLLTRKPPMHLDSVVQDASLNLPHQSRPLQIPQQSHHFYHATKMEMKQDSEVQEASVDLPTPPRPVPLKDHNVADSRLLTRKPPMHPASKDDAAHNLPPLGSLKALIKASKAHAAHELPPHKSLAAQTLVSPPDYAFAEAMESTQVGSDVSDDDFYDEEILEYSDEDNEVAGANDEIEPTF
ncbi:uncharacterized protein LOC143819363 isoform X2 [Paroedura picta]|uniref:uncharacterized protein LOC143819363 isoform X2 n=1 Tax=Paroedura picta TaxID=143630 RepID=UPI0040575648